MVLVTEHGEGDGEPVDGDRRCDVAGLMVWRVVCGDFDLQTVPGGELVALVLDLESRALPGARRTVDALHLAAADRLPRPITYLTFDPAQIPVALALGFSIPED